MNENNRLFDDLVGLTADVWNSLLSERLGLDVDDIANLILLREFHFDEQLTQLRIGKSDVRSYEKSHIERLKTVRESECLSVLDSVVISLGDDAKAIQSIALVGKNIIGFDFSKSKLSESYFSHCVFYNCVFDNSMLEDCTITNSKFIKCSFVDVDFTGSTIAKCRVLECDFSRSILDYINMSDVSIIKSKFNETRLTQSRVLYTGFSECQLQCVDWRDSTIVQCTFINVNLVSTDFRRSSFIDSIFIHVDFTGCDFEMLSITCITNAMCVYEQKYAPIFDMSHIVYSPAIYEWEDDASSDEDEWN